MNEFPVAANNSVIVESHTAILNRRSSQDPTSSTKKSGAPRPIAS